MAEQEKKHDYEILVQYMKDMSFESPSSPRIFFEKTDGVPDLDVGMEVKTMKAGDNLFEVVLNGRVSSRLKGRVLFLVDISYAAMVMIESKDEELRRRVITRVVPRQLFPFMRSAVADITKDSGFAPLLLKTMDFDAVEVGRNP